MGLGETNVNDSLKPINMILKKFVNLNSFEIYSGETNIGDDTFGSIVFSFYDCKNITNLKLEVG